MGLVLAVLCVLAAVLVPIVAARFRNAALTHITAAHGVQARHDQSFDLGEPIATTVFPNPIGMAASFDTSADGLHRS